MVKLKHLEFVELLDTVTVNISTKSTEMKIFKKVSDIMENKNLCHGINSIIFGLKKVLFSRLDISQKTRQ